MKNELPEANLAKFGSFTPAQKAIDVITNGSQPKDFPGALMVAQTEIARLTAECTRLRVALVQCGTDSGAKCLAYGTDTPALRRRIAAINTIAREALETPFA